MIQLKNIKKMREQLPQIFWLSGFSWKDGNIKATTVQRPIAVTAHPNENFISPILKNGSVNWYNNLFRYSSSYPVYAFATEQEATEHYLKQVEDHYQIVEQELQKELVSIKDTYSQYLKL